MVVKISIGWYGTIGMSSFNDNHRETIALEKELRVTSPEDLQQILEKHRAWVYSSGAEGSERERGEQADLSWTDLSALNLYGACLYGANLQGANLRDTDLRTADLREANLKHAVLLNTKLQEADLRNADLSEANALLERQLAGADLSSVTLPNPMPKFEGLLMVEQASKNARTLWVSMLLGCVYAWLTITTTTDSLLLTNSASSPLPIIGTEIPIAGFFWVAPLILLSLYLYFHLYLQVLWKTLAGLPAVFPDGIRLDEKAYPWLLNGLVSSQFKRLRNTYEPFSALQSALSILLAWWIVPITLLVFWLRYLSRHDWYGTAIHMVLIVVAITLGRLFYKAAKATLRKDERAIQAKKGISNNLIEYACSISIFGLILIFSFGAIHGVPHNTQRAADMSLVNIRLWIPRIMESVGTSPFAEFIEADISTKPANWVGKKGDKGQTGLVKGARLMSANLSYAKARNAFLVRADLREANLEGADLTNADLRLANLEGANLAYAILNGANLDNANLKKANLQGVNLHDQNFEDKDLQGINLTGAQLRKINLNGANLKGAYLDRADLKDVFLLYANLQGASFIEVAGLTPDILKKTKNWLFAIYDAKLLDALSLPHNLVDRVQNKNLAGLNLSDASFIDIDLRGFDFNGANLQGASFSWLDLRGANFQDANLNDVDFKGADLRGVTLQAVDLRHTSFFKSDLSAANMQGVNLRERMLVEVKLIDTNLEGADLTGVSAGNWVDFAGANLKGATLTDAHLRNARNLECKQIEETIIDPERGMERAPDSIKDCIPGR